jgi:hypothetical protein
MANVDPLNSLLVDAHNADSDRFMAALIASHGIRRPPDGISIEMGISRCCRPVA